MIACMIIRWTRFAGVQSRLGRCLAALERFAEAESFLLSSYQTFQHEFGGKNATAQVVVNALVALYHAWGKPAEGSRYRSLLTQPTVVEVHELDPLQFHDIMGRLGGFSTRLAGRSVWVFSDTHMLRAGEHGKNLRGSTWSWTDDIGADDGFGTFQNGTSWRGRPASLLSYTEEEEAYNEVKRDEECIGVDCGSAYFHRPGALALDPARGRAVIFYETGMARDYPWGVVRHGSSIALWTDPTRPARRVQVEADSEMLFSAEEPSWGSGAVVAGDDLYAYACQCWGSTCPCLVARAPLATALDRKTWRFHSGKDRWSANWRDAKPVMDGGWQLTVHWNEYLGQYLAIHGGAGQDDDHAVVGAPTIVLRTADRPEGPWSEPRLHIVGRPERWRRREWRQTALGHPEFARDGGRIEYITYHQEKGPFWIGETRLIEITFR